MRVTISSTPCHCSECDEGNSLRVRFENAKIVQNGGVALCPKHAAQLVGQLSSFAHVRKLLNPTPRTEK